MGRNRVMNESATCQSWHDDYRAIDGTQIRISAAVMQIRTRFFAPTSLAPALHLPRPELSPIHHIDAGIRAQSIAQLRRPFDAPECDVRPLAGLERADVLERAQRARGLT